jgi:ribonuclease J
VTAAELTRIGDDGILALVGDSTNVFNTEASGSESDVKDGLMRLIKARKHGRVLVTTFASNAARLGTLGQVAKAAGRELVLAGRSMDRIVKVAQANGYLRDLPQPIDWDTAMKLPRNKVLILCTGAQGEPLAALSRIADGSHPALKLEKGDLVVYSSKQIPGNELAIGRVQNALAARGIDIVTEKQAHVHVSGHPGQPELEAMYEWIRPEIAIPVHGERRHMEAHAALALDCGVPRAMVPVNGSAIRIAPDGPKLLSHEKVGRLVLDGEIILPSDGATIVERRRLAHNGIIAVSIVIGKNGLPAATPSVIAHGVPVEEDKAEFLAACAEAAEAAAAKSDPKRGAPFAEAVRVAVRRVAREWTGKKPVTDVQVTRL